MPTEEIFSAFWANFESTFRNFAMNSNALIRNSAVYSLGVMIEKTPSQIVTYDMIGGWLELVKASFMVPKSDEDKDREYRHSQDNCVTVVGKIISLYGAIYDLSHLYDYWFEYLPLKEDFIENIEQMHKMMNVIN